MKIYNKSKQTQLSNNLLEASSVKERILGLLGQDKIQSLLIRTRFGIHTFGMKHPIDVLILTQTSKVIKVKKTLKPNRIFLWDPKFDMVIELPEGTIEKSRTHKGDTLEIQ